MYFLGDACFCSRRSIALHFAYDEFIERHLCRTSISSMDQREHNGLITVRLVFSWERFKITPPPRPWLQSVSITPYPEIPLTAQCFRSSYHTWVLITNRENHLPHSFRSYQRMICFVWNVSISQWMLGMNNCYVICVDNLLVSYVVSHHSKFRDHCFRHPMYRAVPSGCYALS